MKIELSPLRAAIKCLDDSIRIVHNSEMMIKLDLETRNLLRSGVIQNFEVAFELCWKFMKKYLESDMGSVYVDGLHRKELFRICAQKHLISDVEAWFAYNRSRNLTSHTYREEYAEDVFMAAQDFLPDAKSFLKVMEEKNAEYKS
ncbi:MAG: nucleotidyltransferase substrate binding protein [Firmicutes bacterium]|nr:nucleotidyltransferase substrate binding protein [Bacillota bacterium]